MCPTPLQVVWFPGPHVYYSPHSTVQGELSCFIWGTNCPDPILEARQLPSLACQAHESCSKARPLNWKDSADPSEAFWTHWHIVQKTTLTVKNPVRWCEYCFPYTCFYGGSRLQVPYFTWKHIAQLPFGGLVLSFRCLFGHVDALTVKNPVYKQKNLFIFAFFPACK